MHAHITLAWDTDAKITALSDGDYQALRQAVPALGLPGEREERAKIDVNLIYTGFSVDMATQGAALVEAGIDFKIKRFNGCRIVESDKTRQVNIQVAIPNLLLFSVTEVTYLEDCCTDELQRHLDDDWRILAVCPAENSRRPTYILGRQKGTRT